MPNARSSGPTKADLEEMIDQATSILQDAYQPETDRESLAAAVGQALDILSGEDEDEEEDVEDDEPEDGESD